MLQERFLSPRAIHFGSQQLFWECYETRACEVHPEGLRTPVPTDFDYEFYYMPMRSILQDLNFQHLGKKSRSALIGQVYEKWHIMIQAYRGCKLSKEEDKLLIISGLAQYFQASLNNELLAGLWRSQICWDLCWRTFTPTAGENRMAK